MKYMNQKLQLSPTYLTRELSEYFTFEVPRQQNLCPHIEVKYGMEKYDYSQLLQDKSIWDCYRTSENFVKEMTLNTV